MLDLFLLIAFCVLLAMFLYKPNKKDLTVKSICKRYPIYSILLWVIIIALSLFSGLRTGYNDTTAYVHSFETLELIKLDYHVIFEPYGGFEFFQLFFKTYISDNPQHFLLMIAFFVNIIFIKFFAKYSKNLPMTILCYFILGPYIFSMAGMKQVISMAISLIAIDGLINKGYIKFVLFILVAATFHPYIICLFILPFLREKIWDFKIVCLILGLIFIISNMDLLLTLARSIGKDYTIDELVGNTVNPLRVVVEMIPIYFSFVGRKIIKKENNELLNLGINMMCINSLMIFMGLFFNPIYFGRIGTYFSSITALTMPTMLDRLYKNNKNKKINKFFIYSFFFVYFVLDITKLGSISLAKDLFRHVSLLSIF